MNQILAKQLAIDFCCTEEMVLSKENIFTEYYRQRFCDFAKFNKTLRKVCGYYRPSSYAYQTIPIGILLIYLRH